MRNAKRLRTMLPGSQITCGMPLHGVAGDRALAAHTGRLESGRGSKGTSIPDRPGNEDTETNGRRSQHLRAPDHRSNHSCIKRRTGRGALSWLAGPRRALIVIKRNRRL